MHRRTQFEEYLVRWSFCVCICCSFLIKYQISKFWTLFTDKEQTSNLPWKNIIVYCSLFAFQLLKDVIEKQTSVVANNLVIENANLERRVDHLERENAQLQRTSKRLHLALKAVFKNREKVNNARVRRVRVFLQVFANGSHRTLNEVDKLCPIAV